MRCLFAVLPLVMGCDATFDLHHLDPPPSEPPAVVAILTGNCESCSALTVGFQTHSARPTSLLFVGIAVSVSGAGAPAATSVVYGSQPLTFITRASNATGISHPNVEQWVLVDPPAGLASLTVTLASSAGALIVGVSQVEGARATDPVRGSHASATEVLSQDADNTVDSTDLDLVIDTVCAGSSVDTPGPTQQLLYVTNVSSAYNCGNSGASAAQGAASVPVHWSVNKDFADWWVDVASSIAPAGG